MYTSHAEFPIGPFTPYAGNPIMRPRGSSWESGNVYNPAAIVKDDTVVLLYRAHADDVISHVGMATSDDGIHFERSPEPVLSPSEDYERYGCEDPRVTEVDGTYYLTYTGWDREHALLCLATSSDLRTWTRHGPLFPDFDTFRPQGQRRPGPWSKAGGILPVPIDGHYLMYFGEGSIWSAWSDDLIHWTPCANDEPPIMAPMADSFTSSLVEVGPPPIVTNNGLILLLHNASVENDDGSVRYTCGQLLFSPDRPTEILAQLTRPWLEPTSFEETHGLVPNVTFVQGLVHFKDTWFAYYGQGDSTLGVATYRVGETFAWPASPANAHGV